MILGDLLSACPHRQFHTLPGLLDSWAALSNSYPNALRAMQGGSLYHFHDGFWYDPAGRWTHDLPCERRTRGRGGSKMMFDDYISGRNTIYVAHSIPLSINNMQSLLPPVISFSFIWYDNWKRNITVIWHLLAQLLFWSSDFNKNKTLILLLFEREMHHNVMVTEGTLLQLSITTLSWICFYLCILM